MATLVQAVRPIPVSSPAGPEPPPRFRWLAPLGIGAALGAVLGGGVAFAILSLATRPRGELVLRQFSAERVVSATPGVEHLSVTTDATAELGGYNRRSGGRNVARRRIVLSGEVADANDFGAIARVIERAIHTELARFGSWSSTGSTISDNHGWFESIYYTRDGRQGQMDLEVVGHGTAFRATILLFEAK